MIFVRLLSFEVYFMYVGGACVDSIERTEVALLKLVLWLLTVSLLWRHRVALLDAGPGQVGV